MLSSISNLHEEHQPHNIALQSKSSNIIKTWANTDDEESAMKDDHYHLWLEMIRQVEAPDLSDKIVLDYGCNQGGFLNVLYEQKGFKKALGVDIAEESIAYANKHKLGHAPSEYAHIEELSNRHNHFDVAFSHEVLYLISNLRKHASDIFKCLKKGGVYYAAIGCHVDNPLWDEWLKMISEYSNIPVQSYSLDDYARAFFDEGFEVSARPYQMQGFVPLKRENAYFPKVSDSLRYHSFVKTLFKFEKK